MNNFVFKIKKDFRFHYQKKKFFRKNIAWQLSIDTSQDLIIKPGFVAVLGESGTGKSTLISIMGGFEHLDKEQAQYISYCHNGKEINYADKSISSIKKKEFGYIFQRCYESKSLNAIDNITMPLVNGNYCAKTAKHYCNQLLESLGLNNLKSSSANELSGGQLTRIGILRGIAQTPTVLFADEPANNLDEQNAGQILDILQQWQQHTNGTVIMVTHHRKHAFKYADQLIVFQSDNPGSGKIVFYKESEQKQSNTEKWTDSEIKTIEQMLLINHNNQLQFPEPPEPEKNCITNRIGFLIKTAWQNNVSKADGSRTISLITLSAFVLLFFTIFAGTLLLKWFHQVDQIKNNDAFLRRFDIKVLEDPGLSKELQDNINNISVIDIQRWLISKIDDDINQLNKQCSAFVQTYSFAKLPEIMAQQFNALSDQINMDLIDHKNQKAMKLNFPHDFLDNLGHFYKQKSCQISKLIHQNKSIEQFDRKSLRIIAQKSRKIERLLKFLSDIAHMDVSQSVCEVYPRWEAGPEFVKKNGQRRNMTTTIRWLDHRDPFLRILA
ncbi:MAG: hypothetical protein OMM_06916 [Candidatus Magnetoglobus multicellularis str. Araruama]|uniref:ABC transporter domain-containing protein n=1 Tax=Candidatus Magnetoglobus multicellularis str. Araruama TaxID=890399 RepID=A0A1V1PEZ4_9BACT|nr:MAG: hypothetical protein OMM_06916 [Candidatus Magnetoglobus multicellularis str. Araruama]